ncbi:MAG TPA: hypothetical protein VGO60_13600 [Iamia sp.]|jgi:hypothetical protein|nr:hypothetical protein [Iamia sp.]
MRGTQRIISAVVFVVLALGGYGCRYALREATEGAADKVAQDAIDDAADDSQWRPPTTVAPTTTESTVEPEVTTTTTAPVPEDADSRPKGWPAGLELVEGLDVQSTSDVAGLGVIGRVKGELTVVTDAIRADLTAAGFAIDPTGSTDPAVGGGGSVTQAAGPMGTATVLISPVPEQPGTLLVTYRLQPTAG